MSRRYPDEHALVLGADTLPPCACRVPQAVWINRPAPRRRVIAVVSVIAACFLLGLAGVVAAAGAEAIDVIVRAAGAPFSSR